MKPAEKIKRLIKKSRYKASPEAYDKALGSFLQAVDAYKKQKSAITEPNMWRIIMKSKITKLAAAAMIIIAAIIALHNGSVDIASPAFGIEDVLAAMQQAEWMHATAKVLNYSNVDPNRIEKELEGLEWWQSINPNRAVSIEPGGIIWFHEENLGKIWKYDPEINTITITYRASSEQELPKNLPDVYLKQVSALEKTGAKVEYSTGTYDGGPVQIIKVAQTTESGFCNKMDIIADAKTRLAKKITMYQKTAKGESGTISMVIDYPATGPTDIYQAGAPRDAEVKVIDNRPAPEFLEEIRPYRNARDKLISKYILIATHSNISNVVDMVDVIYNDDRKQRFERHLVFTPGDAIYEMWPVYSAAMGTTFDSMLRWAQQGKSNSVDIDLYDGQYHYGFERNSADEWSAEKREYWPNHNLNPNGDLADLGWPRISNKGKVVENSYAQEHNLLCIERRIESEIKQGKLIRAAEKWVYYLDPQQDYMCIRQERYRHRWRTAEPSIHDIDFDPEDIPYEPYAVTEVTALGQTDTGQWYPKRIEHSSIGWDYKGNRLPLRLSSIRKIFLETSCQFPVDIFVPAKVIPKDGQAELSLRQSYDEIVKEAIAIVDIRVDWPEPKELVQRYWQARSAKDYDTMSVLWPGSATRNQKLLADEEPAEYVFGETVFPQYGGAYVPYAEKSYYEKNSKYNLKMWLHNEKSTKGRYYIISGN